MPVRERIRGIDTVRGLIMVIMTLDHSRDFLHFQGPEYAPTNMATTTVVPLGGDRIIVLLYSALPWSGILLIGYRSARFTEPGMPPTAGKECC